MFRLKTPPKLGEFFIQQSMLNLKCQIMCFSVLAATMKTQLKSVPDPTPWSQITNPAVSCGRISGLMLAFNDIHIEVPSVDYGNLRDKRVGEPSASVKTRMGVARERQRERFGARVTQVSPQFINGNAEMRLAQIWQYCQMDETCNS